MDSSRIRRNLLKLCAVPSISNTQGERDLPEVLGEILREVPYFQKNPQAISILPCDGDPMGGSYLMAYMPSPTTTPRTILLLSHFDVVAVEEFGIYKELAFDPEGYTAALKEGKITLSPEAQADLQSGNYLFGRGISDMKWGLAADVELLHYFDSHPQEMCANLLLVSTPDEERNSRGMLSAVPELLRFREENQLEYIGCVVGEPDITSSEMGDGHRLHVGAAGKIMPAFYCVGKETHVGEPYSGLNADLLAASVVAQMELDGEYIDFSHGCCTPAPTCLKLGDMKTQYSVQTPCAAYAYFNMLTLEKTPEQVLERMEKTAVRAFEKANALVQKRCQEAGEKTGQPNLKSPHFPVHVISYEAFYLACKAAGGEAFEQAVQDFVERAPEDQDIRQLALEVIETAYRFYPYRDPAIILFFCPPYYPHSGFIGEDSLILRACNKLIEKAAQQGEKLEVDYAYQGITDMCYLSLGGNVDIEKLKHNVPVWGERYRVPLDAIAKLNIPFVNIGPHGKDAHKNTERIEENYSFGTAPGLLLDLIKYMMELK